MPIDFLALTQEGFRPDSDQLVLYKMTAWIDAAEVARNPTFDDRVISGDFATAKREDHVEQGSRGSMRRGILVSRLNISLAWCEQRQAVKNYHARTENAERSGVVNVGYQQHRPTH